jgi:hypothetical protein
MSSGLDTATRRQIRKAFGGTAMQVIEAHEAGLSGHAMTLASHEQTLQSYALALRELDATVGKLASYEQTLQRHDTELKAFGNVGSHVTDVLFARGFFGRLRWLLRGT